MDGDCATRVKFIVLSEKYVYDVMILTYNFLMYQTRIVWKNERGHYCDFTCSWYGWGMHNKGVLHNESYRCSVWKIRMWRHNTRSNFIMYETRMTKRSCLRYTPLHVYLNPAWKVKVNQLSEIWFQYKRIQYNNSCFLC